jgi:hypothetical protein
MSPFLLGKSRSAMPIWIHRLLGVVLQVAGFFGGALAGFCVCGLPFLALAGGREPRPEPSPLGNLLAVVIGGTFFVGGSWLGRHLCYGLFVRNVAARCPHCGGRAYLHSENARQVRYRCRSCRYVYVGDSWEE